MDRWQQIESLFTTAVKQPSSKRDAWLRHTCAGDSSLCRAVASLLAHDVQWTTEGAWAANAAAQLVASAAPGRDQDAGPRLESGTTLGPYSLVGVVGAGAMGRVYRARDVRLNRDVAIKTIPKDLTQHADPFARLHREAQALGALNHPNIGGIYDVLDQEDASYLVLEFVEGPDLAERLRDGPLPVAETVTIASQIADALHVAHAHGIVHRDLKPANIKVTADGRVKVLDFGISKDLSIHHGAPDTEVSVRPQSHPHRTLIAGTPAYMSPEQACGFPVDARADLWAFGCVVYELLTGRRAFQAATASGTLAAIVGAPSLDGLPGDTPAALTELIGRCLRRDVDERIQDAGVLRRSLDDIAAHLRAGTELVSPTPRRARPAKVSRPVVSRMVDRQRLFRRLDATHDKPVTWVSGPPGAGKTTLVASYLAARGLRSMWYQVDDGDADVATFFYYLGRAASRHRPLPLLTPEYRQGLPTFSRRYFGDLFGRLKVPFVLVLDNYQEVPSDAALHGVMREAVAELPAGGRVIFISRSEPPAELARMRAHQMFETIDWQDLRFSLGEARRLARIVAPGRWPSDTIDGLHALADGWCAGLVLSFGQLATKRHLESMPSLRSSDLLFDYFATEIFKNADPQTQDVLLKTAFVPWVTPSIARTLVGRAGAEEVLLRLHRQNYFTNCRLSGGEPVYEYHPLFRDFLLARGAALYPPARRTRIRRRAAQLTETAGDIDAAAVLLRDAEDWPALASFVCRHAPTLLGQGRGETVERWLTALPESTFDDVPWVRYWRGICWFAWRHADSQRDLGRAFELFRQRGDITGVFLAWAALIIAYEADSNTPPIDPWVARIEEFLHENAQFPSREVETRVTSAMLAAITLRRPDHPDARRWADRALELARLDPDLAFRAITIFNWLTYQTQRGDHAKAASIMDELRALLDLSHVSPVVAVNASVAVIWYEAVVTAGPYRRTVSQTLELAQATGMFYVSRFAALGFGLFGALGDGDLETAEAWAAEIKKGLPTLGPGYNSYYCEYLVRAALTRGDVREAALHRPEMLRHGLAGGWCLHDAAVHLVSAQVLHLSGDAPQARTHLDRALAIGTTMQSPYVEFMARLVEAEICLDGGQDEEGLRILRVAMALGKAGGFVNSRVWQPRSMARLYARALEAGIEVDYVRDVIERRQLSRFLHTA